MNTKKIAYTGLFLALGLTLPFLTGQIPAIGQMLLPMHIPVFLCALICGAEYGLTLGLMLPLIRSFIFSMPPFFIALAMMFEMGAYGLVSGLIYQRFEKKDLSGIYISLIPAMIAGRIVWGIVMFIIMGVQGKGFTFEAFMSGIFFTAIPGIVLQLILIPIIIYIVERRGKISLADNEK